MFVSATMFQVMQRQCFSSAPLNVCRQTGRQLAVALVRLLIVCGIFPCLTAQICGAELDDASSTNSVIRQRLIRPDGKLTPLGFRYTTAAYEREALRLVVREANAVALQLELPEHLPIKESDLMQSFIVRYGMSLMRPGIIGNVHTHAYGYFVSVDHKLSYVERAHQDRDCLEWMEQYRWSKGRIDTNGAYQLATQWLAAAEMDVDALNRDCRLHIELDSFANQRKGLRGKFVPIYFVYWESAENRAEGYGDVASVKLLAPTKTLISLRVEDARYIRRAPLIFTNLDSLLSEDKAK